MIAYGIMESSCSDEEYGNCGLIADGFSTSEAKTIAACKKIAADWWGYDEEEIKVCGYRNPNGEFTIQNFDEFLTVTKVQVEE